MLSKRGRGKVEVVPIVFESDRGSYLLYRTEFVMLDAEKRSPGQDLRVVEQLLESVDWSAWDTSVVKAC